MPVWPSYAHIQLDNYVEQRETALKSSEMESGPPKVVLTMSRVMVSRPVAVLFRSRTDYLAFISWFQGDIKHGALWFDWSDPVTGTIRQARIKGGELGDAAPLGSISRDRGWRLTLTLEAWQ